MISKLLTKQYIFGFLVLLGAILLIIFQNAGVGSAMLSMALRLLIVTFLILIFFNLLRLGLSDEKNSYRSMLMERPLFNPRGKKDNLSMIYPFHPRFIAIYFDHDEANPYHSRVFSIQALRYEYGYYTDSLFLPLRKTEDRKTGRLLTPEDASKLLTTYTKGFPLVVHAKDYAAIWLSEHSTSVLLTDAIDTEEIARLIYGKLTDYGIEEINDWLRFEVDERDPVYGAKITAAIYLDYLRLYNFDTTITMSPLAKESELKSIYPDDVTTLAAMEQAEEAHFQPADQEMVDPGEVFEKVKEETTARIRYIGPFTPLDEKGFDIPERGHLVSKEVD